MIQIQPGRLLALRILTRLHLLDRMHLYPSIAVDGRKLRIPIVNGTGYSNFFSHEPWLDRVLRALLAQRDGTFVDVGANIGQTLLKFLGAGGNRYLGFEPNPQCLGYLESLCQVNALNDVEIVPTGLSDHAGVMRLFLSSDVDSSGSAVEGFRPAEEYATSKIIPVLRGDDVLASLDVQDAAVIKIDVEGGELEVLRGIPETLRNQRPFVICEILPVYEEESPIGIFRRMRTDDVETLMRDAGYSCHRLLQGGGIVRLDRIETHNSLELCEYLFVPIEREGSLGRLLAGTD